MKQVIITAGIILSSLFAMASPPSENGKAIFIARCASCHNVNKKLTGPALAGIDERHSAEWIVNFVHSSQTLIKSGDKEAVAVFEENNKVAMPDHPDLTAADVANIIAYVKEEAKNQVKDDAPFQRPHKMMANYTPLSITKDYSIILIYFGVVALLVVSLLALVNVKSMQRDKAKNV